MAKRILAVDDEKNIARLVQVNLGIRGYKVDTASDGREALEKIAAECPDLILLDVMMPHVDGFEVLRRLKENPDTRHVPVIMLSVRSQDETIAHAWEQQASGYLNKPFEIEELVNVVEVVLAGGRMPLGDSA